MILTNANIKPHFLKDIDFSFCKIGEVYNIYECLDLECIIEHKEDVKRKKQTKLIKFPSKKIKNKLFYGYGCKHKKAFLIKYKKCTCGTEIWGPKITKTKTCVKCFMHYTKVKLKGKKYFRLKIFKFISDNNLSDPNRWDCNNRSYCLESTFKNGIRIGIACLDCPFYDGFTKEI